MQTERATRKAPREPSAHAVAVRCVLSRLGSRLLPPLARMIVEGVTYVSGPSIHEGREDL